MCERWVGDRTELQPIDPPPNSSGYHSPLFPVLLGCSTRGLGAWGVQPLLGHGSHSSIFSPTSSNILLPGLYDNLTPHLLPASVTISHSNSTPRQSRVAPDPPISSTGCTCYLHWCISSFDSLGRVGGQYATKGPPFHVVFVLKKRLVDRRFWQFLKDKKNTRTCCFFIHS